MSTDERNAVAKALAVLHTLHPPTASAADIEILREASYLVTRAMAKPQFSSETELNNKRGDAANTLSAVTGAPVLTEDTIDKAKSAVAALLSAFDTQNAPQCSAPPFST
jgi:hypothetical protein